jgi:hypothetical protein
MPAETVSLPLTGFGDSTVDVAVDQTPEGAVELVKLAVSTDNVSTLVPANANGLTTQFRLDDPHDQLLLQSNLSPGANVDLTAAAITTGKVGRLLGADLGCSVPCRYDIQVTTPTRVTRTTIYTMAGETFPWRVPIGGRWIELAGGPTNAFGLSITNLSASRTADVRGTLYYDEVAP